MASRALLTETFTDLEGFHSTSDNAAGWLAAHRGSLPRTVAPASRLTVAGSGLGIQGTNNLRAVLAWPDTRAVEALTAPALARVLARKKRCELWAQLQERLAAD